MLGQSIEEIKQQMLTSGDTSVRDLLFKKSYKKKIQVHFDDLIERYDDYFRRPIFFMNVLKNVDSIFDVERVFDTENSKGFTPNGILELNQFASGTMDDEVMKLLAAGPSSKKFIELLKTHIDFLSKLYLIRSLTINLSLDNIENIKNLIEKDIENAQHLKTLYEENGNDIYNTIKFQAWEYRLNLNLQIAQILEECYKSNYENIHESFPTVISNYNQLIDYYTNQNEADEDEYPLYLIMVFIEGFNIDKRIVNLIQSLVEFAITSNIKLNFEELNQRISKFLLFSDSSFNGIEIGGEWDSNWLEKVEEPFTRLFKIIDNLAINTRIINGSQSIKVLEPDFDMPGIWQDNTIIHGKDLDKTKFNFSDYIHVKSSALIYIPIAVVNAFAVLKKGFLFKGGDEFESYLLVNPYFRLDPTLNSLGYARAFSYLDIEGKLKERDTLGQELNYVYSFIESNQTNSLNRKFVLPLINTESEIEEFVQAAYDLLYYSKEGSSDNKTFDLTYNQTGIKKNMEKLSGEFIEYIYVPVLVLNAAFGKYNRDQFSPSEQYSYKFLMPYNANPKNPFDKFLKMDINPETIMPLLALTQKFYH